MTYLVCLYLLLFTNFVPVGTRLGLGYSLLALFACFIGYNTIIMLIKLCHRIRLEFIRIITKFQRKKLKSETTIVRKKIRLDLHSLKRSSKLEDKDWFMPDDVDEEWEPEMMATETGGGICVITLTR